MGTTEKIPLSKKEQDKLKELYQQVLADETLDKKGELIHQCATCGRYKMESGNFKELAELSAKVRREAQQLYSNYQVSHTMCQPCYDATMKEFKNKSVSEDF